MRRNTLATLHQNTRSIIHQNTLAVFDHIIRYLIRQNTLSAIETEFTCYG